MDKLKKSLLIGLVLGDGHLNPNSGVALEISHGHKQKFYVEWKARLIAKLLNCKEPKIYHRKDTDCYKISKGHRYFRILRKWMYTNKEKHFSENILSYVTPEAIAIWWMDDGTHAIERNKTTGKISSHKFGLATMTNMEDTQNIINMFDKKYDIKMYPIKRKKKDGTIVYNLQFRTREGRKFSNLIRPYILREFEYKIMKPDE